MARGQNLLNKVYNKPLLITLDDLQPIADYLSSPERVASLKFEKGELVTPKLEDYDSEGLYRRAMMKNLDINPDTMTGTLYVDGLLVNREGSMNSECVELTSYQGLKKRFEMQVEEGIQSCILMISSGGGEAFGAWSTANYVKKVAAQSGVKLTAYINGSACSAAYVWTVVADEVVSHPMGVTGSVGVLVQLYNDSKMLNNLGVERSFVYAGGNKIPFDKNGGFTEKFISDLQASVDKTYNKFVTHVATHRNLTEQQVIDTQASVYDAEEALELGFVDKIMELEDFELQYGLKKPSGVSNQVGMAMSVNDNNKPKVEDAMTVDSKNKDKGAELLSDAPTLTNEDVDMNKELQDKLNTVTGENKVLSSQVDELTKQLKASNDKAVELNALVEQKALEQRNDARKLLLENALGKDNDKVESLLASTSMLSDEQFEVVAGSFALAQNTTQENLKEYGGEGQESMTQLDLAQQFKKTAETMNSRRA